MPPSRDDDAAQSAETLIEAALDDALIFSRGRLRRLVRRRRLRRPLRARLRRHRSGMATLRFGTVGLFAWGLRISRLELRLVRCRSIARWDRPGRGGCGCGVRGGAGRRRRSGLRRLPMGNEIIIAGGPGPGRRIGRQAAGPMRDVIGHKAGKRRARAKHCGEAKPYACRTEALYNHWGRRAVEPARRMHRALLIIPSDREAGH